jgi:hypothetical protein
MDAQHGFRLHVRQAHSGAAPLLLLASEHVSTSPAAPPAGLSPGMSVNSVSKPRMLSVSADYVLGSLQVAVEFHLVNPAAGRQIRDRERLHRFDEG